MSNSKKVTIFLVSLFCLFVFCLFNNLNNTQSSLSITAYADSSVTLNDELQEYLLSVSGTDSLTSNSFTNLDELVFDGTNNLCNNIVDISGLEQFDLLSLTKITVRNMTNLVSANFTGQFENKSVFPNLTTLVIENCNNLTSLSFNQNNKLSSITISLCEKLNFVLDDGVAQNLNSLSLKDIGGNSFKLNYIMPNLRQCTLQNNASLTDINLTANNLTEFYVISNSNLVNFYLSSNSLSTLNFKDNVKLQTFDVTNASNIKTFELDNMSFEENGIIVERKLLYAPNLKQIFVNANDWIDEFDISKSENVETIIFTNCAVLRKLDLATNLQKLQSIDLSNCYNLNQVDINSAINLKTLSLSECSILSITCYENVVNMLSLQNLNLQGTNVKELVLENLTNLQVLILGSKNLNSLTLHNLNSLYLIELNNVSNLKSIELTNAENLTSFDLSSCENIQTIKFDNVALNQFNIAGLVLLNSVYLNCPNLQELYVYDCSNLNSLVFNECENIKTLKILGCDSLNSEVVSNFTNLNLLENVYVSECPSVFSFELANKPNIKTVNLSNLNNLTILSLTNLGVDPIINLPNDMKSLRSLTLSGLKQAQFSTTELDLSDGVLSAVTLVDLPFTKINLNDNYVSAINISGVEYLQEIQLSNNRITNVESVITLLNTSPRLMFVNINNNRIDFSDGSALNTIQSSIYGQWVVIGVQNIIDNNDYTYKPEIYFGGLNPYYTNFQAVMYHSSTKYSRASLTQSVLNGFSKTVLAKDKFTKLDNGTYYITYEKLDSNGNVISMTAEEKALFLPIYFTVSTQFDFIQFIWIIFVAVAGLIFIYVGISFWIEKRRKARLLGEDLDVDGGMGTTLSMKEIKQAEKEHRKLFKESEKLDKQERKNQAIVEKGHKLEQKEQLKEQKALEKENAKMKKIADKEHKKQEKERLKQEKEQQKLDKEREKLLKEREQERIKQEANENKKASKLQENVIEKNAQNLSGEVSAKEDKKAKRKEQKENYDKFEDNDEMFKISKKFKDKELRKEQKELKKLEKRNLKEERMREKAEDKGLFSKEYLKEDKKAKETDEFEDLTLSLNGEKEQVENLDSYDNTISDKDLADLMNKTKPVSSPSMAKELPKMPKMPKLPKK